MGGKSRHRRSIQQRRYSNKTVRRTKFLVKGEDVLNKSEDEKKPLPLDEDLPDWTKLHKDLLGSIIEKLVSISDYLQFSVVCKSWHCVAKDNKLRCAKISSCHQPPMLLISTGKDRIWKVYNVMENKVLNLELRIGNKRFCGSSKGWLIAVDENFVVSLINPFLRVKKRGRKEHSIIRLPPLNPPGLQDHPGDHRRTRWASQCDHFVFKAIITADPIQNANNCIVVVKCYDTCQLAFIRLNKDTTWTYFDNGSWNLVHEVVHVEDKFYVVEGPSCKSLLLSFDVTSKSHSDGKSIAQEIERKNFIYKRYLVDLNEKEFLMVHRDYIWDPELHTRVTKGFKVFGLNLDKCEWIEKKTLGDVALFVGDNSSVSVLASNFSRCQPNCIYFNHDTQLGLIEDVEPGGPRDFGVYNMEKQSISWPYTKHAMKLVKMTNRHLIWVVPTIQL